MLMTSRCYFCCNNRELRTMNFLVGKSSFNVYRKQSEQEENHSQCHPDQEKQQNILSQNSFNAEQNYARMNNFQNDQQNSDLKDQSQQYLCITCNRTYDGLIKCRHGSEMNQSNEEFVKNLNNRTYTCPYDRCQKKFNLQSGLIRHKVVHTGQRPYSCDYESCSQSFNQKSNLNRHKKIHKNEKPFICDKCCKSFTTTTNLKQHSQTHIPKKQERKHYTCEMKGCNKKYLYRCNLKKHKQEHEDPVGGLMIENQNQKNVTKAKFEISLGQCNITLQLRDPSVEDHSEMKIVYDQNLAQNAQIYNPAFIMPSQEKQQKDQAVPEEDKTQQLKVEENLVRNLQQFFINKASQISASFYIHPELIQYGHIVIGQVITLLQQKGTRQIRFFTETKQNFSRCVQNLMQIYFVQSKRN